MAKKSQSKAAGITELKLHSTLRDPAGARHRKKRKGCGEGSGHGKTSCRGGKGQTARSGGKVRAGFEGGQMPLVRRIPKYGFKSRGEITGENKYTVVNLSQLAGLEDGTQVNFETLADLGIVVGRSSRAGIKVLADGAEGFNKKLNLTVNKISNAAKEKIESLGGSVTVVELAQASQQEAPAA